LGNDVADKLRSSWWGKSFVAELNRLPDQTVKDPIKRQPSNLVRREKGWDAAEGFDGSV